MRGRARLYKVEGTRGPATISGPCENNARARTRGMNAAQTMAARTKYTARQSTTRAVQRTTCRGATRAGTPIRTSQRAEHRLAACHPRGVGRMSVMMATGNLIRGFAILHQRCKRELERRTSEGDMDRCLSACTELIRLKAGGCVLLLLRFSPDFFR